MPYIVTYCWYPNHLADKVAKRYLENMQKYPIPDIIKRTPPGNTAEKDGIESIVVDEVKSKNMGAAWEYLDKFLIAFRDIEGFRWQRKIYGTVAESLKLVGMG